MNRDGKIFVTGHRGMVGSALVRRLQVEGYERVLTRSRTELDLLGPMARRASCWISADSRLWAGVHAHLC